MALSLELAQTVALGSFNPYIITPEWLARMTILPAGESEIRFKLVGEGTAFELQSVRWEVDLRRLVVSSLKHDCGDIVARVLDHLRHTPVRAIGNNFHFTGSLEDWGTSPGPTLGQKSRDELAGVAPFESARWSGTFRRKDVRVEVTVLLGDDDVAVLVNHHRDTNPTDFRSAIEAARRFGDDREVSEQLLRSLLAQEVKK